MLTAEARKARNEYMRKYRQRMSEEQREKVREYQRNWRKNNPELVQRYQADHWVRKAKEMKQSDEVKENE